MAEVDHFEHLQILQRLDGATGQSGSAGDITIAAGVAQGCSGYSRGEVIKNRYEILARTQPAFFKAKDLQTNRIVGLRLIGGLFNAQPGEDAQAEIARLRNIHHPNLTIVHGLEWTDAGMLLVTEWFSGFTLLDLLRARHELRWTETLRLVRPLAKLFDFLVNRDLLRGPITLKDVNIEPTHSNKGLEAHRKSSVDTWPPFLVKVDIQTTTAPFSGVSPQAGETMVRPVAVFAGLKNSVQPLAHIIYELLGGVFQGGLCKESTINSSARFIQVPALSESGNAVLKSGVIEPTRFSSAIEFLAELEGAESANLNGPSRALAFGAAPLSAAASITPAPAPRMEETPEESLEAELRAEASPWLLRLITTAVVAVGLVALGTLVRVSFFVHKETPTAKPVEGFVTLDTKPSGASVRWNGQEIGTTPITSHHLPAGKQILELQLPGYSKKLVDVIIANGTINNLGLIPLVPDTGQFVVRTNPPDIPFEITDSEQKTTSGVTPLTVDNMPTGKYQVKLKRPGWPEITEDVELTANATVNIQHTYEGANDTLKSDTSGGQSSGGTPDASDTNRSNIPVRRASLVRTPPDQFPTKTAIHNGNGKTAEVTAAPTPDPKPTGTPRVKAQSIPIYRTKEDWQHARDEAYGTFDAQWDAKKNAMKEEKRYIDYWIKHSSGNTKEQWKYKKKVLKDEMDRLDDEKDAAKEQLKRQWSDG